MSKKTTTTEAAPAAIETPAAVATAPAPVRALNSASNLSQRFQCPGSALAEFEVLKSGFVETDGEYATEGTMLHWYDANPEAVGNKIAAEEQGKLTAKHRQILQRNASLREQVRQATFTMNSLGTDTKPFKVLIEKEFFLCDMNGVPWVNPLNGDNFPGHPDRVEFYKLEDGKVFAIIFDSKFGRKPVEPSATNLQLRCYAVMLAENYEFTKAYVSIQQPWLTGDEAVHSAVYEWNDIPDFKYEILGILANANVANAPRSPGRCCDYCIAKAYCGPATDFIKKTAIEKVGDLTPAQLEELWFQGKIAKKVLEAVDDRLKTIAKDTPELLTKLELKGTGSTRDVFDPISVLMLLQSHGVLSDNIAQAAEVFITEVCKVSATDLESLVAANRGISEDDAKTFVATVLAAFIKCKDKAPTLAVKKKAPAVAETTTTTA